MKSILKIVYMFFRHPFLFFKYTLKRESKGFFVNGSSRYMKSTNLVVGKNVRLGSFNRINFFSDEKLSIGNDCYICNYNTFLIGGKIRIGNNTSIASFVSIISENHVLNPEKDNVFEKLDFKDVEIGDNCWVGEKAIILPGVSIGDCCIIAAGAVVTKNVPSNSIVAGNPAKIIKIYDFEEHKWIRKIHENE